MTMVSKDEKLILISEMGENPSLPEKLDFLKKIFDPRFPNTIKKITKENLSDTNNQRTVFSLYAEQTTPEKIDAMEVSRLYFLEQAKKENQKKCLNCSNVRNQDEFVKYWKRCIFCLDMTVEEANEKGAERDKKKTEGILCSTCNSRKCKEEFGIKKDGNYSKTCIKCIDKRKKKKPEETPEPTCED
jgi:hypothetical protein